MAAQDDPNRRAYLSDLRHRAEELLAQRTDAQDVAEVDATRIEELVSELSIHQVELEMQNEELRQAQQRLEKSSRRYFALFDLSPTPYFVLRPSSEIVEVNFTAVRLIGLARKMAIGRVFTSFVEGVFLGRYQNYIEAILHDREPDVIEINLRQSASRRSRTVLLTGQIIEIEQGQEPLLLVSCEDVTERRQAERSLRESEARFQNLAEVLPVAVFRTDAEGRVTYANRLWGTLTGRKDAECESLLWFDVVHGSERNRVREQWNAITESAATMRTEFRLNRPDGGGHWVLCQVRAEYTPRGERIASVATLTDIEARKKIEQELVAAKEEAVRANRAKSDFLSLVSHEIRTPLNSVLGCSSLLVKTGLDEHQRGLLEIIEYGGETLLELINNILDLSKIEAGRIDLEEAPFSPWHCLRDVVKLLSAKAREKKLDLRVKESADVPACILGDQARVRQVLINLIGNALKFTHEGHVEARMLVRRAEGEGDPRLLCFEIEDTGVGMTPAQLQGIFTPFSQADASTSRRFPGTGLGLAICKQISGALGGGVTVQSEPGTGSTFTFTLPLKETEADGVCCAGHDEPLPVDDPVVRHQPEKLRILVADDVVHNQIVMVAMLKQLGYAPQAVGDGQAAVEAVRGRPFDLIFMDVRMPVVDGFRATEKIRALESENTAASAAYIIALTADALQTDKERCIEAGMNDYLAKPLRLGDLRACMDRYLASLQGKET